MSGFDDIFASIFGGPPSAKPEPEARPLPQIRGHRHEGVLWVRAEDVADALESQAPTTNARLIKKLRA
jgi:hypothetical protein